MSLRVSQSRELCNNTRHRGHQKTTLPGPLCGICDCYPGRDSFNYAYGDLTFFIFQKVKFSYLRSKVTKVQVELFFVCFVTSYKHLNRIDCYGK